LLSSPTAPTPSDDDIEPVIQMATAAAQNDPCGASLPLCDTRTQLFIANLPYRVRWQDLKVLFRCTGTVLHSDVSLGPDNCSHGYGTVLLATVEDAGRAVDVQQPLVAGAHPRGERGPFDQPWMPEEEFASPVGRNLFIGNVCLHSSVIFLLY
jgi:hypothetical protein